MKRNYDKHFARYKSGEVFFFSRGFSGETYYMLKNLSKHNTLVLRGLWRPHRPESLMKKVRRFFSQ
jgi:hypothetical protein